VKYNCIIILLLLTPLWGRAQYSGGTGTAQDPYQIATLDDMRMLSETSGDWDKHFVLTDDIDAADTENWNDGKGFSPVGSYDQPFTGSFNGQDRQITGLFISRAGSNNIGLFGVLVAAEIKNLVLDGFQIEGGQNVGALAGEFGTLASEISKINFVSCTNCKVKGVVIVGGLVGMFYSAVINNCHFEGVVSGSVSIVGGLAGQTNHESDNGINSCQVTALISCPAYSGGLVGLNQMLINNCRVEVHNTNENNEYFGGLAATNISTIVNCTVSGEIKVNHTDKNYIGGLVAVNTGKVKNCHTFVNITAELSDYVGGIAGRNEKDIMNCYTTGQITGRKAVGGLTGIATDGSQTVNCYSTAVVTGGTKTGGLVGENSYFATITDCYAAGKVNSEAWFSGGFVGLNRSTAFTYDCFFDPETTGKENGTGMDHNGQNQEVTGLETAEFGEQTVFENAGWQFGNTSEAPWKTGTAPDGKIRPVFYYQNYTVTFLADTGGQLQPEANRVQTVNCGNNSDTIRAIPDKNYLFRKWETLSGDSVTNVNPLVVFNVVSDTTLVAVFRLSDGIYEFNNLKLSVFPNPAKDYVIFQYSFPRNEHDAVIELHNPAGVTVFKKFPERPEGRVVLNTGKLPAGIYFYTLKTYRSEVNGKVVILK